MRSNCANASTVRFCAASSTALRYSALRCRRMAGQLAGLEIGMVLQNPQRIATRDRSVLAGVAGQNDARIPRQIKQPLHVVHPHRPGFIQHHQLTFGQTPVSTAAGFAASPPRILLCAKHPLPPPSARRTAVQSSGFLAGGDQLAQRRGFAAARQTAQAGDAVTGAQHMINRPALIFAQPVGRPVAGMQRRDRIATRVDRLNQIQFRCQNLLRGKSAFRFHQVRRILHRRFQRRSNPLRPGDATGPRSTVHAPAPPTCARTHGRRHGSGLGFPVQRHATGRTGWTEPSRVFAAIAVHPADNCANWRSRTSAVEMPLTFSARL